MTNEKKQVKEMLMGFDLGGCVMVVIAMMVIVIVIQYQ